MPDGSQRSGDEAALTVSELTREIKELLEASYPSVWVSGEISNCRPARSGHVYLTLKDEQAQLSAVIWRNTAARLPFELVDGLEVVAQGSVDVYPPRGSYQLIIRQVTPRGVGALELAFRQLQERLAAEGLFDEDRKRPLPRFPERIALVTSPTGAAVRDMLQVITRRWPAVEIVLLPVRVQGSGAAEEIAAALARVPLLPRVDVVIAGRGGGSLEDLWAFNEEVVARAIAACPVPVVSAVGHEIDVSIADLVADVRALTPSEAGELVVPRRDELRAGLVSVGTRLAGALRQQAERARSVLTGLASRPVLARPHGQLRELAGRADELQRRLDAAARGRTRIARDRLGTVAAALQALSPLEVLARGYSMTLSGDGGVIREADQLAAGDEIVTVFSRGRAISRIESVDATTGQQRPESRA
ncbi:MAG: exodeoxyribonuclease VII large subunit [Planctomycetaceae bacterium]|jgi:exodeoxyribonuclease VII large subunit|nr:exodeoxyribonuclease VII large subunit [Planctomycetaceae bacterium]